MASSVMLKFHRGCPALMAWGPELTQFGWKHSSWDYHATGSCCCFCCCYYYYCHWCYFCWIFAHCSLVALNHSITFFTPSFIWHLSFSLIFITKLYSVQQSRNDFRNLKGWNMVFCENWSAEHILLCTWIPSCTSKFVMWSMHTEEWLAY